MEEPKEYNINHKLIAKTLEDEEIVQAVNSTQEKGIA